MIRFGFTLVEKLRLPFFPLPTGRHNGTKEQDQQMRSILMPGKLPSNRAGLTFGVWWLRGQKQERGLKSGARRKQKRP
jgi:hypothetical protein